MQGTSVWQGAEGSGGLHTVGSWWDRRGSASTKILNLVQSGHGRAGSSRRGRASCTGAPTTSGFV